MSTPKSLRKVLTARTTDEILTAAKSAGLLQQGKVSLAGQKVALRYEGVDLSVFRFDGTDLTGSQFTNCSGEGAVFEGCKLVKVRFVTQCGQSASMKGATFNRCTITGAYFGARTLNLSSSSFAEADIKDTKFMLGALTAANFSGSRLQDVQLRDAHLERARFCGALLERVNLEKASMKGADFTGATFNEMEHWGAPDYTGAIVPDALLFQSGIVPNPVESIDEAIESGEFNEDEKRRLLPFRERVASFASDVPEAMLIATEYEDIISFDLFAKILKRIKST